MDPSFLYSSIYSSIQARTRTASPYKEYQSTPFASPLPIPPASPTTTDVAPHYITSHVRPGPHLTHTRRKKTSSNQYHRHRTFFLSFILIFSLFVIIPSCSLASFYFYYSTFSSSISQFEFNHFTPSPINHAQSNQIISHSICFEFRDRTALCHPIPQARKDNTKHDTTTKQEHGG